MLLNCGVGEDSWVLWSTRRSKQSILKEISPDCSLEGLMLKLKLQYFDEKNWLIGKDPDSGKDWGQEEKGMTGDEMVRWHHRLNGHGFGWTLAVGDGQGGLACCGVAKSRTREQLKWVSEWERSYRWKFSAIKREKIVEVQSGFLKKYLFLVLKSPSFCIRVFLAS